MSETKNNHIYRVLDMYQDLIEGKTLHKQRLADTYGVSEKTIQRDIQKIRDYFFDKAAEDISRETRTIQYNRRNNVYMLSDEKNQYLQPAEVLAISKILVSSRAFAKRKMEEMIGKLKNLVQEEKQASVEKMLKNELEHYVELVHNKQRTAEIERALERIELSEQEDEAEYQNKRREVFQKDFISRLELLSQAIDETVETRIWYKRQDGMIKEHRLTPVALLFSDYYFYLVAYSNRTQDDFVINFRVDRIQDVVLTNNTFKIPYAKRFKEGEFKTRLQFMNSGPLKRATFEYFGPSVEAIFDRLPNHKVLAKVDGVYTIEVETYGNGIQMFFNQQRSYIKVLEIKELPYSF